MNMVEDGTSLEEIREFLSTEESVVTMASLKDKAHRVVQKLQDEKYTESKSARDTKVNLYKDILLQDTDSNSGQSTQLALDSPFP